MIVLVNSTVQYGFFGLMSMRFKYTGKRRAELTDNCWLVSKKSLNSVQILQHHLYLEI